MGQLRQVFRKNDTLRLNSFSDLIVYCGHTYLINVEGN